MIPDAATRTKGVPAPLPYLRICACCYTALTLGLVYPLPALAQDPCPVTGLKVAEESRLDWKFPLLGSSPVEAPAALSEGYLSRAQKYNLYAPPENSPGPNSLVIFVSHADRPVGQLLCEPTCAAHGVLLAELIDQGNGKPLAHRVRAVLDVLDDVRRRYDVDPDRTYLAGYSGGGQVACKVALALPEYFGGVAAFGAAAMPIDREATLLHVRDRLSIAMIVGDHDPVYPLVADYAQPWWQGMGVRAAAQILPHHGHPMPGPDTFEAAFNWLEEGLAQRRAAAKQSPSSRIAGAPTRAQWSALALADAQAELAANQDPARIDLALTSLEGIANRWPDLPAATSAKKLLADYAARKPRPWETARDARRLQSLRLTADGLDRLAHRSGSQSAGQQPAYAAQAIQSLKRLKASSPEATSHAEIDARIADLEKIAAKRTATAIPINRVRFDMKGDVTLAEGIEHLRAALARIGYEVVIDEQTLRDAGVDLDKPCKPRLQGVELDAIEGRFLRPAGVKLQRKGRVVSFVPVSPKESPANR